MQDLTSRKLTFKNYLVVASLLFGLFFGAGNLIFPLHLGQLAGSHWGPAAVGFLITGVLLPLLSVLAVAVTFYHFYQFSPLLLHVQKGSLISVVRLALVSP